jgi:hypothetical protein
MDAATKALLLNPSTAAASATGSAAALANTQMLHSLLSLPPLPLPLPDPAAPPADPLLYSLLRGASDETFSPVADAEDSSLSLVERKEAEVTAMYAGIREAVDTVRFSQQQPSWSDGVVRMQVWTQMYESLLSHRVPPRQRKDLLMQLLDNRHSHILSAASSHTPQVEQHSDAFNAYTRALQQTQALAKDLAASRMANQTSMLQSRVNKTLKLDKSDLAMVSAPIRALTGNAYAAATAPHSPHCPLSDPGFAGSVADSGEPGRVPLALCTCGADAHVQAEAEAALFLPSMDNAQHLLHPAADATLAPPHLGADGQTASGDHATRHRARTVSSADYKPSGADAFTAPASSLRDVSVDGDILAAGASRWSADEYSLLLALSSACTHEMAVGHEHGREARIVDELSDVDRRLHALVGDDALEDVLYVNVDMKDILRNFK